MARTATEVARPRVEISGGIKEIRARLHVLFEPGTPLHTYVAQNKENWNAGIRSVREKLQALYPHTTLETNGINHDGTLRPIIYEEMLAYGATNPEAYAAFIDSVDLITSLQSNQLKEQARKKNLHANTVIIGTGPTAVMIAQEIQRKNPNQVVIMVDEKPLRGGKFRGKPFYLNSPTEGAPLGLPGESPDGDANNFGTSSALDIRAIGLIKGEKYPSSRDAVYASIIGGYDSADGTIMETKFDRVKRPHFRRITGIKEDLVFVGRDAKTGKEIPIYCDRVIRAEGIGTPKVLEVKDKRSNRVVRENLDRIITFDEFREGHFPTPAVIVAMLREGLALVGAGNGGDVTLELVSGALDEAIANNVIQADEKPKLLANIYWIGQKYSTKDEYLRQYEKGFDRYDDVAQLLPEKPGDNGVKAISAHAIRLRKTGNRFTISTDSKKPGEQQIHVGHIISAIGYNSDNGDRYVKPLSRHPERDFVFAYLPTPDGKLVKVPVARKLDGENVFDAGPTANLPLTDYEKSLRTPSRSQFAIRRYGPRNIALADLVCLTEPTAVNRFGVDKFAEIITQAEHVHAGFEEAERAKREDKNWSDPQWAEYYADKMIPSLEGFGVLVDPDTMAKMLRHAETLYNIYEGETLDTMSIAENWQTWYAKYLLGEAYASYDQWNVDWPIENAIQAPPYETPHFPQHTPGYEPEGY